MIVYNMGKNKLKHLSKKQFEDVFLHKPLKELLQYNLESFPLVYYFMNYFLGFVLSDASKLTSSTKYFKFSNIIHKFQIFSFYIRIHLMKKQIPYDGFDVLFLSIDRIVDIVVDDKKIKSDYLFYSIINHINKECPQYKIGLSSSTYKSIPSIREIRKIEGMNDIRLYSFLRYITPITIVKSVYFSLTMLTKWKARRNHLRNNIHFCAKEYETQLLNILDGFFTFKQLLIFTLFDFGLQSILTKTGPKLLVLNDDFMNLKPRSKDNAFNCFILQSSMISELHSQYKSMFLSTYPMDDLMADYFLVNGQEFKDIKIRNNVHDSKNVLVTGRPRYDSLYYADTIYSKEKFLEKHKINRNHKIILWTTQCHGISEEENIKNFKTVFETLQNLKDVTLIIKQHPGEGKRYTKMIKEYLNKYNLARNAIVTPKDSDTYEQLFVCDLIITRHSTTAMEAVALNKPVIVLNLSGEPDVVDYVKKGVALGVYEENDLEHAIKKLLNDDSELAKKREEYIKKYLYKIDGKSTERVVQLIEKMLKDQKIKGI